MEDVILLNNLFNGEYIKDKVGGEIINMYQADNDKYYIYANPYGNINKKWDNRIKYILFIRSVGNKIVKIIGKAKIKKQICLNAVKDLNSGIDEQQKKYIDQNNITYGTVKINELGTWSNYFVTFEADGIYKATKEIYLSPDNNDIDKSSDIFILKNVNKINNQSQKLYIEKDNENFSGLENIINNESLWSKSKVSKVNLSNIINLNNESFLSIIKKENDEIINSNLLAYYLKKDKVFWKDFATKVLQIEDNHLSSNPPNIIRESIGNIDFFIENETSIIIIENKIKSGINGIIENGYSQLEKYYNIVNNYNIKLKKKIYFYVLRPDYNNEDYKKFNMGDKYKEIKYSEIYEIIKNRINDPYFEEFKNVVMKHSKDFDNELFEIMDDRFIEKIKKNKIGI